MANGFGRDLGGLILLPVVTASHSELAPGEVLPFRYQLSINGHFQRLSGEVVVGPAGELPWHSDHLVLLHLLQLAVPRAHPEEQLTFHRSDLLRQLGWYGGGLGYERLAGALRRLQEVRLRLDAELLARDGRPYGGLESEVRLIDSYSITEDTRPADCVVRWGGLVREGLRLGDLKRLDLAAVQRLRNPFTVYLYRLLDRVGLCGAPEWAAGWKTLATALGAKPASYSRPSRFRQMLQPHLDLLVAEGLLGNADYERGGRFVLQLSNGLRGRIRRALVSMGVADAMAGYLVQSYDEVHLMTQCDCLLHGSPRIQNAHPVEYLLRAIAEQYPLHYTSASLEQFEGLWRRLAERESYHAVGLALCEAGEDPALRHPEPRLWSPALRAVVRFLVDHQIEPRELLCGAAPAAAVMAGVG